MAKRQMNPRSLENLRPSVKGMTNNPNGRPKTMRNALKDVPKDMREQVYNILAFALTLPDETTAKKYLEMQQGELGQYGFVLQIAIKQLLKEGWGFSALMAIFDRLYGKPRESSEVTHKGEGLTIIVNSKDEKDKLDNIGGLEI